MIENNFAVFILSHGRPDNVATLDALKRSGYTGKTYIIIDNEDSRAQEYFDAYGDMVIQFDKKAIAKTFDTGDTQPDRRTIIYARHASQVIAKDMGLEYLLQLDDDYTAFYYRTPVTSSKLGTVRIRSFDNVVNIMLTLLDKTGALTVALSQGGDLMGGINSNYRKGLMRKAMNSFFIRTDRPINFVGRINEDVNAYVLYGTRGEMFFTTAGVQLTQKQTQANKGGMTEMYLDSGTYVKSFYTVMMAPSCTTIRPMGITDKRLHHSVKWENAVPKIIHEKHRKVRATK